MNENEKKYNEEGLFKSLTSSHGNIDGELSHFRNTFLEVEREYFKALLSDKDIRNMFQELASSYNNEQLFETAMEIYNNIEMGTIETKEDLEKMKSLTPAEKDSYHLRVLEKNEGMMTLLLAATTDKVKLLELVKTIESEKNEDEYGNNKTR